MTENKITIKEEMNEFLFYTTPDGDVKIEIIFHDENIWLSQKRMAELFDKGRSTITEHLQNIFNEGELLEDLVCRNFRHTESDGKKYNTKFYNIDAILSVGYRVNSSKATQFRIWATNILKEYVIKGFVMDDERLKNGRHFGKDYFQELLERVRSIRASERRIYQKITDLFAECSFDYDRNSEITRNFYASVQNKFHYAITGKTGAEIVYENVDATKVFMGLKTWKNKKRIVKSDTIIAKNYLEQKDIKSLERAVSSYFDYIERLIEKKMIFSMEKLSESVNNFLEFNEYEILNGKGLISHKKAEEKAFAEYDEYNKSQQINSDFDEFVKGLVKGV